MPTPPIPPTHFAASHPSSADLMQRIERIIRARADHTAAQQRLVVDYYRIGRKLAYPLPATSLQIPSHPSGLSSTYPWAIWKLWTLQERIVTLGTSAHWFSQPLHRDLVTLDLRALAHWPSFDQFDRPHLAFGHAIQTLCHAHTHWSWLDGDTKQALQAACHRAADQFADWSDQHHAQWNHRISPVSPQIRDKLHNIPIIGQIALAMAAHLGDHPAQPWLLARACHLVLAQLDARDQGHSEAVAYDGYVWSFAADLVPLLNAADRESVLGHPQLKSLLNQSPAMAAPGNLLNVARIGDVEPYQMPFHVTAIAKLLALVPCPHLAWYVHNCPLDDLRSDALAALHDQLQDSLQPPAPAPLPVAAPIDAHYATVLRSGWAHDDLAVAISSSQSQFGHIHHDAGHLTIGSAGHWLVTDPGYQQYVPSLEREFTLGPAAHNAPLVDQQPQTRKGRVRRLTLHAPQPNVQHTALELTACYESAHLDQLIRHVWLIGNHTVVVADRLTLTQACPITWHWQSHPHAAWWIADGMALLHLPAPPTPPGPLDPPGPPSPHTSLWIRSLTYPLEQAHLDRHPGSRGSLTLTLTATAQPEDCHWWIFTREQQTLGELDHPSSDLLITAGHELTVAL